SNCTEWRAGQVEVGIRGDRHDVFVKIPDALALTKLHFLLPLSLEQLLGVFSPCTVVIFIKDHTVPVRRMDPFIFRLDAAGAWIASKVILKRTEAHKGLLLVGFLIGQTTGLDELPAFEIHMLLEIRFP